MQSDSPRTAGAYAVREFTIGIATPRRYFGGEAFPVDQLDDQEARALHNVGLIGYGRPSGELIELGRQERARHESRNADLSDAELEAATAPAPKKKR